MLLVRSMIANFRRDEAHLPPLATALSIIVHQLAALLHRNSSGHLAAAQKRSRHMNVAWTMHRIKVVVVWCSKGAASSTLFGLLLAVDLTRPEHNTLFCIYGREWPSPQLTELRYTCSQTQTTARHLHTSSHPCGSSLDIPDRHVDARPVVHGVGIL